VSELVRDDVHIVAVPVTHPDAVALVEAVQEEYVVRYGGRDDTPLGGHEFGPGNGAFYVGYAGDEPVVSGAWRWLPLPQGMPWQADRCAEIKRMYVVPSARGLGHAHRMLAHLEADAAAQGAEVVVLETGLSQPEAIGLYTSSGYRPVPAYGHYSCAPASRCFGKALQGSV
jgi:GNAT superfamily N-acetyltransferase